MSTCKDCIHEKVCDNLIAHGLPWEDGKYPAEKYCDHFKPTADVVEVRHGEWVYSENEFGNSYYRCSICDCQTRYENNYCSNCGAQMGGEERK